MSTQFSSKGLLVLMVLAVLILAWPVHLNQVRAGASTPVTKTRAVAYQVKVMVTANEDDATQTTVDFVTVSDPYALGKFAGQTPLVGLRFQNITIPAGAEVSDARLELTQLSTVNGEIDMEVFSENGGGDHLPFGGTNPKPTTRLVNKGLSSCNNDSAAYSGAYCGLSVPWTITGTHSDGDVFASPNLAGLIQEQVGRSDWIGNGTDDLVLIIRSRTSSAYVRYFYDYDWGSDKAAKLTVQYRLSPDVNHDGEVNIADLQMIANAWRNPNAVSWADLNGDGVVNIVDIQLVSAQLT